MLSRRIAAELYAKIRGRMTYETGWGKKEFDETVKDTLTMSDPKPEDWVAAAEVVKIPCGRCAGTGQFVTMVENGVPKGPGGICFRCEGKSWQNYADVKRNHGYDVYYQRVGEY